MSKTGEHLFVTICHHRWALCSMGHHRTRWSSVVNFLCCLTFQVSWHVSSQLSLPVTDIAMTASYCSFLLATQPGHLSGGLCIPALSFGLLGLWSCLLTWQDRASLLS